METREKGKKKGIGNNWKAGNGERAKEREERKRAGEEESRAQWDERQK
jgi:hypothetical protein